MLRSLWRPSSILRNGSLGFVLAIGMVLSVAGPSPAGTPSRTELPPKVKPAVTNSRSFHGPRAGSVSSPGDATRLCFCVGDDWEPEVAAAPDGQHVYVVLAHFPGDPTCDPASGNRNRIYIQVSGDGGVTWGAPHLVADTVGGVDYPRQVDCVVTVDPATGAVYVSFLIYGLQGVQTDVAVAKSMDFGQTFTAAKVNGPECANCDHPWTVAYGNDVYTAYAHARTSTWPTLGWRTDMDGDQCPARRHRGLPGGRGPGRRPQCMVRMGGLQDFQLQRQYGGQLPGVEDSGRNLGHDLRAGVLSAGRSQMPVRAELRLRLFRHPGRRRHRRRRQHVPGVAGRSGPHEGREPAHRPAFSMPSPQRLHLGGQLVLREKGRRQDRVRMRRLCLLRAVPSG